MPITKVHSYGWNYNDHHNIFDYQFVQLVHINPNDEDGKRKKIPKFVKQ